VCVDIFFEASLYYGLRKASRIDLLQHEEEQTCRSKEMQLISDSYAVHYLSK